MKTLRHFRLGLCLALTALGLAAAEENPPVKLDLGHLSGVPTPLEEYGLSIGDITVTRVINPLGQLRAGSPVMYSRRLKSVTNPWSDLQPGTALVVDGKKAIIMQLQPAEPINLTLDSTVKLTVQEIAGTTRTLTWAQNFTYLNSAESTAVRETIVKDTKKHLRVGSHLIVDNARVVVTSLAFSYDPKDSTSDGHLKLNLSYSGNGTLSGQPTPAGELTAPAWDLRKNGQSARLTNKSVQLVTWEITTPAGTDVVPRVTVLHRARGTVQSIKLSDEKHADAVISFKQDGHTQMRDFHWALQSKTQGRSWRMDAGGEDFAELFFVNDSNIRFRVTPEALVKANEAALKFFRERKTNTDIRVQSPSNVSSEALQELINNLKEIVESDASQTLKIDAKRQAVIHLARFYEHSALSHHALASEYLARARIKTLKARMYERHSWANRRKLDQVRALLIAKNGTVPSLTKPAPGQPEDLIVKPRTIGEHENEIAKHRGKMNAMEEAALRIEHAELLRRLTEQAGEGTRLRQEAEKLRAQANEPKEGLLQKVREEYLKSLQFWTEYIHRTEGLAGDRRKLSEQGVTDNLPPPDPFIPEILLRQAWIYRKLGQPDRAMDKLHDVLKSATVQKIDNLARFGRIYLVARSQIADTYARDALKDSDYDAAIDKYEVLLRPAMKNPPEEHEELDLDEIQLQLLRTLFRVNEDVRMRLRRLELRRTKLQTEKPAGLAAGGDNPFILPKLEKIQGEINALNQRREGHWKRMITHATMFIERYGSSESGDPHPHSGEVMYYKIIANQALGNHTHVQRDLDVLLNNESTPILQRQVWATTRVRVMIDIANLLFNHGAQLMATDPNDPNAQPLLARAQLYYRWTLANDQTYRSQILIRQQIAFCQERLAGDMNGVKAARDTYAEIAKLTEMHPIDVKNNPAVRVTRALTQFRLQNLNHQIKQQENSQPPTNTP